MQKFIDTYDFKGKRVIARVDFNVPLDKDFKVTDDTRIRAAVPTIKKVLEGGGSIILMSHLGRPKGVDKKYSLEHIIYKVEELLGQKIQFCPDCMKADEAAKNLKPGDVLLLVNSFWLSFTLAFASFFSSSEASSASPLGLPSSSA